MFYDCCCEIRFDGDFAASILAGIRAVAKDNPGLQHNWYLQVFQPNLTLQSKKHKNHLALNHIWGFLRKEKLVKWFEKLKHFINQKTTRNLTQLVVWCWFSTTLGTDLTLVWQLNKLEGRGGRWETGAQFGGNFHWDLGSMTIFYGCMLLGGGPDGYWLEETFRRLSTHIYWRYTFKGAIVFSWCAGPGDKLHWGPDPLWSCHWARQEGRHQGATTFSCNSFWLFSFSIISHFSIFFFAFIPRPILLLIL